MAGVGDGALAAAVTQEAPSSLQDLLTVSIFGDEKKNETCSRHTGGPVQLA